MKQQVSSYILVKTCPPYFCEHEQKIHCSYIRLFVTIMNYLGWYTLKRNARAYLSPASCIIMACGEGLLTDNTMAGVQLGAADHIARQDAQRQYNCQAPSLCPFVFLCKVSPFALTVQGYGSSEGESCGSVKHLVTWHPQPGTEQ